MRQRLVRISHLEAVAVNRIPIVNKFAKSIEQHLNAYIVCALDLKTIIAISNVNRYL